MMKYIENQDGTQIIAIEDICCKSSNGEYRILVNGYTFYKLDSKKSMEETYDNIITAMNEDLTVIRRTIVEA